MKIAIPAYRPIAPLFGYRPPRPFSLRVPSLPTAGTAWGLSHPPLTFGRADAARTGLGSFGAGRHSKAGKELAFFFQAFYLLLPDFSNCNGTPRELVTDS